MSFNKHFTSNLNVRGSVAVSVLVAAGITMVAATTWWWQANLPSDDPVVDIATWHEAKKRYPSPKSIEFTTLPPEMLQGIILGNLFSPDRGLVITQEGSQGNTDQQATEPAEPKEPIFIYKGNVKLGSRLRAIVEDVGIGKTYFLEVGQEVAGYKVLDIAENRVVLSHPKTNEEIEVVRASDE